MKAEIKATENGYILTLNENRNYVYKTTEEYKMLEFLAYEVAGLKVRVVDR